MKLNRVVLLLLLAGCVRAETGYDAWLRYPQITDPNVLQVYAQFPATVVTLGSSPALNSARDELSRGIRGMLQRTLRISATLPSESSIVLGTLAQVRTAAPDMLLPAQLTQDA